MTTARNYVHTSKGLRLASQVISVRGGAKVSRPFSDFNFKAETVIDLSRLAQPTDATAGGWVSWVDWRNAALDPITSFVARWIVPPAPVQDGGQTIYLFNGLQDGGGNHILQPVLQWGPSPAAGSGPQWGIACFWVGGPTDPMFCSEFVPVQPGTALTGRMDVSRQANELFSCTCSFDGKPETMLTAENLPPLVDACLTLEAYGIRGTAPYPPAAATDFDAIDIEVGGVTAAAIWSPFGGAFLSTAGVVEVAYPAQPQA